VLLDADTTEAMQRFVLAAESGELDTEAGFRGAAKAIGKETGVRGRGLFHPLRELTTGQEMGPELARLIPLIQAGARLGVRPDVLSVQARLAAALEVQE
jgi:glutamyl/glutaminyl-tRNA synthetase